MDSSKTLSPEYWMSQLKSGHEEALAHLMARFEKPVFAFLYRRLYGEVGVVQELTQEVFLKCLQHKDRFEEGRPVSAWIFTLAANAATDHLRKRGRELPAPETFDAPDPHQLSPWEKLEQNRKLQNLKQAIEGLTPRQRAMVVAYYVEEKPVKMIADQLSCAEGTVKATLFQVWPSYAKQWMAAMLYDNHTSEEQSNLFDIIETPENWPEDPNGQAMYADLLEIHLAILAHRDDLSVKNNQKEFSFFRRSYLPLAAAFLFSVLPIGYTLTRININKHTQLERSLIKQTALKRAQYQLWGEFFQQSLTLINNFNSRTLKCTDTNEDRTQEREMALTLLQASHQLSAQGAPLPEAEAVRNHLHAWLTELSLEDSCIKPERVQELRQLASFHQLPDDISKLSTLLKQAGS